MKGALSLVLKLGISALLIWLFLKDTAWSELEAAGRSAGLAAWLVATGLFVISNLLGALQWGALLRVQGIELPTRTVIVLYFVGVFFNNFLVSNIGGDAVRVYDLKRLTGRATPGFAATFLDRFIGLFALIAFSVVAFAFDRALWSTGIALPIGTLVLILAGILCFGFSRRLSGAVLSLSTGRLPERVTDLLSGIRDAFLLYRGRTSTLVRIGVIAAGVQLSRIAVYYAVSRGMGLDAGFHHFVVFIPLIAIVAAVPISFGGIGVRENLGAILFGQVGVGQPEALALMLLGYLAGIAASLAGGIAFVMRRTDRRGQEATP